MDEENMISTNVEFLKKCDRFNVPSSCKLLQDSINSFYSKCIIDSLNEANKALDYIVPFIVGIKTLRENYEEESSQYKEYTTYLFDLCTAVSSLVLEKVIEILNVSLKNSVSSLCNLANNLLQGRDILSKMKSLYLDSDFINKRLNPNFNTINQLFSRYNVANFTLPEPYDLRTELETYNDCKKSEDDCKYYLAKYPKGKYTKQVLDVQFFFTMGKATSIGAFLKYIEDNPKGRYVEKAISKINEYHRYAESISLFTFKELKKEHSKKKGTFLDDAVDNLYFSKCKKISHFKKYVDVFGKKSNHYQIAKSKADNDYEKPIVILSALTTGLIGGVIGGLYGDFWLGFTIGLLGNIFIPVCLFIAVLYSWIID